MGNFIYIFLLKFSEIIIKNLNFLVIFLVKFKNIAYLLNFKKLKKTEILFFLLLLLLF